MDIPEIIKELTALVMALAAAIIAVMTVWIKLSQTRNANQSSLEKKEIKDEIKLEIVKAKENILKEADQVKENVQTLKNQINLEGLR